MLLIIMKKALSLQLPPNTMTSDQRESLIQYAASPDVEQKRFHEQSPVSRYADRLGGRGSPHRSRPGVDQVNRHNYKSLSDYTTFMKEKCLQTMPKTLLMKMIEIGRRLEAGLRLTATDLQKSFLKLYMLGTDATCCPISLTNVEVNQLLQLWKDFRSDFHTKDIHQINTALSSSQGIDCVDSNTSTQSTIVVGANHGAAAVSSDPTAG